MLLCIVKLVWGVARTTLHLSSHTLPGSTTSLRGIPKSQGDQQKGTTTYKHKGRAIRVGGGIVERSEVAE
jgi:hypothetical protein